jgi:hypothetical protein
VNTCVLLESIPVMFRTECHASMLSVSTTGVSGILISVTCTCVYAGFGVIHSDAVEHAFRAVDRRFFVPSVSSAERGAAFCNLSTDVGNMWILL